MFIFFVVVIVVAIIAIFFILFKIIQEQSQIVEQEQEIEEEDNLLKKQAERKKAPIFISDSDFEKKLSEAEGNPEKIEELKTIVQNTLRKDLKDKNMTHARVCNNQLKKIDAIEKKGI